MINEPWFIDELDRIIHTALKEDIGDGDHSSLACIPADKTGKAQLLVKESAMIAGVAFAQRIFEIVDQDMKVSVLIEDGNHVNKGDIVFEVEGLTQSILKAERLVLNSMQRMSAIATKTNHFVSLLQGTHTQILDTRKTTPGIRAIEKWAVKIGGGTNHRFALYDMIMLKDNHIDYAGGIDEAIQKTKSYLKANQKDLKIIVEARDLEEIQQIIKHDGIYRILIDNFSPEDTVKAVKMIGGKCLTESSGGITENSLKSYAACGVDFISSGALTHQVQNIDLSLKALT